MIYLMSLSLSPSPLLSFDNRNLSPSMYLNVIEANTNAANESTINELIGIERECMCVPLIYSTTIIQ